MKTDIPLNDDPAQEDLLRRYWDRVEKFSQQDRVSKFCSDAGFLTTVEVGQYSWSKTLKNWHSLQNHWLVLSTLCPEMKKHHNRKDGFEWTPRLDPNWKLQPVAYKVNMEWKLEWVYEQGQNSYSWIRISHGLNKLVSNLNNKDQDDNEEETSEMQFEDDALKLNASDFASRSKAKAKPQRLTSDSSST